MLPHQVLSLSAGHDGSSPPSGPFGASAHEKPTAVVFRAPSWDVLPETKEGPGCTGGHQILVRQKRSLRAVHTFRRAIVT